MGPALNSPQLEIFLYSCVDHRSGFVGLVTPSKFMVLNMLWFDEGLSLLLLISLIFEYSFSIQSSKTHTHILFHPGCEKQLEQIIPLYPHCVFSQFLDRPGLHLPFTAPPCSAAHLGDAGPGEGYDDGHHIDSELELQEFGDAVINIATPHHCLDDAGEIVISQDDVRGLFRHIGACYALRMIRK